MDEQTTAWRTGVFRVLKEVMKEEKLQEPLEVLVFGSRVLPPLPFHFIWKSTFDWLISVGEDPCVEKLQKYYFRLDQDLWTSDWNGSISRLAPGFNVGTQPQEKWHLDRVRPSMPSLYMRADAVVAKLKELLSSRAQQAGILASQRESLRDVPGGMWIRSCVRAGRDILQHPSLAQKVVDVTSGTTYWCMRKDYGSPEKVRILVCVV